MPTWGQNLYALYGGGLGGVLPDAVAGLTKGQVAVLANEGCVAFGDRPIPKPIRKPKPSDRAAGKPSGPRSLRDAMRRV